MNLYVELLVIWLILIAVGYFLTTVSLGDFPIQTLGMILIIIGIVVLIIWIIKLVAQFIPAKT